MDDSTRILDSYEEAVRPSRSGKRRLLIGSAAVLLLSMLSVPVVAFFWGREPEAGKPVASPEPRDPATAARPPGDTLPDEDAKRILIGEWQGSDNDAPAGITSLYQFFPDGTFSYRLMAGDIEIYEEVQQWGKASGRWSVSENCLFLKFDMIKPEEECSLLARYVSDKQNRWRLYFQKDRLVYFGMPDRENRPDWAAKLHIRLRAGMSPK